MSRLLRKFSLPVLVAFWVFTWHAYAVGAVVQEDPSHKGGGTVLKQHLLQDQASGKVQRKTKFKRRPFITKSDVLMTRSFWVSESLSHVEDMIPAEIFLVKISPQQTYLLRSPPQLI